MRVFCLSAFAGMVCAAISVSVAQDKPAEKPGVKVATETRAAKAAQTGEAAQPGEAAKPADPFTVPDGTVDEIYAYLNTLDKTRPPSNDRAAMMEFVKKFIAARKQACEKILAADAPLDKKKPAAGKLFETIQIALRVGDPQAIKDLQALPAKYEKLKLPEFAAAAKGVLLQINLQMAMAGMPGAPPLNDLLAEFKKQVEVKADPGAIRMVMSIIDGLSRSGKTDEAVDLCSWAEKVFGKNKDEQTAKVVEILKGTARRLQLPGKTMIVKGETLDGKPYDLTKEKGKVVLVQYWATWCQPCLAEIPNIMKNYQLYHDRGFNVVGVSIDQDKAALDAFLEKQKLPWPMIHDPGTKESNAMRYGVVAVPRLILVDKEGKVVTLDARGPKLGAALEKLLGPAESKAPENLGAPQTGAASK